MPFTRHGLSFKRKTLGLAALLFAAGAAILSLGLMLYFQDGGVDYTGSSLQSPRTNSAELGDEGADNRSVQPNSTVIPVDLRDPLPFRMIIKSIGVDAPMIELGLDEDAVPQVPLNGADVAWYDFSVMPGEEGNAVFSGHLEWQGSPAVFTDLKHLQVGDTINLISENGKRLAYVVSDRFEVDSADRDALKVMGPTPTETITLITCGGTWIPDPDEQFGGDYSERVIVQATRIADPVPIPALGL